MKKTQLIEGLTAELYGLIGTISVYKQADNLCFEQEYSEIKALRKEAFEMTLENIRRQFQNLRVTFQMRHMLGMRSLRCRCSVNNDIVEVAEFHTGDRVMLTHPIELPDMSDGTGYVRIKGHVINILGDSTLVIKPEQMICPDGNAC